jgi:CelD/BcsL family acetyltransferase involved in cellulose biosynthesis
VAVLPLLRRHGVAREWRTPANEHTSCWGFAMRRDLPEVGRRVVEHLLETADRLSFRRVQRGGLEWCTLRGAARELGLPACVRAGRHGDTWLALPASVEALEAAMPARLANDLRGKLARLRRTGRVELARIEGGPELASALEACFAVEAQGWKGFTGMPVKDDPRAHRFYCELARRASPLGQLALYVLEVDGEIIAFRYCVRGGSRIDSLKTSFAPAWARYSPGLLAQLLIARRETEDGTVRTFHVGQPSTHKLRWASGVQDLATVDIYSRRLRGHLASWPPRMLDAINRFPPVRRSAPRWQGSPCGCASSSTTSGCAPASCSSVD